MKKALDWDGLLASLNDDAVKLDEKGWNIFRYFSANIGNKNVANNGSVDADEMLSSEEARMLLLMYMKLPLERPSLLHSMMLGVALKMTEAYADFKLPIFLKMWDLRNLRKEDRERQKDDKGKAAGKRGHTSSLGLPSESRLGVAKTFHSLAERLAKVIVRYRLEHPDEAFDEQTLAAVRSEAVGLGFLPILPMVAVKMWEAEANGRKMRFVKLVGPKGEELSADWHLFRAKPWEIVGQMYDVLPRRSAESGNIRVDTIVRSTHSAEEVFGKRIGFVDRYDEQHKHYHIFDSDSRHFVAESPKIRPTVGSYVWFAPIIPEKDKFKSAIVLCGENVIEARQQFGITPARVTSVNKEKGYFLFQTDDDRRGLGDLKLSPHELKVGDEVRLIIFLKRSNKDGEKRLYVAEMICDLEN